MIVGLYSYIANYSCVNTINLNLSVLGWKTWIFPSEGVNAYMLEVRAIDSWTKPWLCRLPSISSTGIIHSLILTGLDLFVMKNQKGAKMVVSVVGELKEMKTGQEYHRLLGVRVGL